MLLLVGCGTVAMASAASAAPALWVAFGNMATVYLFGTFPRPVPASEWQTQQLETALSESEEVWVEVADARRGPELRSTFARLGDDATHPLSGKIGLVELGWTDNALRAAGVADGVDAVEGLRPWLIATMLMPPTRRAPGFDFKCCLDVALRVAAIAAGKQVRGFQSLEDQIELFGDLPSAAELQILRDAVNAWDDRSESQALHNAWLAGDVAAVAGEVEARIPPALWHRMYLYRNKRWAPRIAAMLQERGTKFVAVDAGHFAGDGGILRLLEKSGVTVERIQ